MKYRVQLGDAMVECEDALSVKQLLNLAPEASVAKPTAPTSGRRKAKFGYHKWTEEDDQYVVDHIEDQLAEVTVHFEGKHSHGAIDQRRNLARNGKLKVQTGGKYEKIYSNS